MKALSCIVIPGSMDALRMADETNCYLHALKNDESINIYKNEITN